MSKEEQLQEIKDKLFDIQKRILRNGEVYCEEFNKFNKKGCERCNEIDKELYDETIWRMQDYEAVESGLFPGEELNYDDYTWLKENKDK